MNLKTFLAATAAALTLSAPASADVFVAKNGSNQNACTEAAPCLSIAKGVLEAQANETIHVGPGEYVESVSLAKGVRLAGAGSGDLETHDPATQTIVRSPNGSGAITATVGVEISDLKMIGQDSTTGHGGKALDLRGGGATRRSYTLERVTAIGGAGDDEGGEAIATFPIDSTGTIALTVTDSLIGQADDGFAQPALSIGERTTATVLRSIIRSAGSAVAVNDGGDASLVELDVRSTTGRPGIYVYPGGFADLRRSTVRAGMAALTVDGFGGASRNARAEVRDSLLEATGGWTALAAVNLAYSSTPGTFSEGTELLVRGSTLVASGPSARGALLIEANWADTGVSADLANTLLRSNDTDGGASDADIRIDTGAGEESVTASHSSFTDVVNLGGGTVPTPGSGTNVAGAPALDGEHRLPAGSRLVDAGSAQWAEDPFDAAGAQRITDGDGDGTAAPDIGAFERPAAAPPVDEPAAGAPAPEQPGPPVQPGGGPEARPADRVAPSLRGLRISKARVRRARRGTTALPAVQFTLSEAASVEVVLERAVGRGARLRWSRAHARSLPAVQAAKGRVAGPRLRAPAAGRYRFRIVAVDAAGNPSKPHTLPFRVLRAR